MQQEHEVKTGNFGTTAYKARDDSHVTDEGSWKESTQ